MIGPGLGGGFGRYQGFFGLILDNIVEMNVVLADGALIKVSDSSHPDLYWGMRGAGHNFGIVTRFKYRIYDNPAPLWTSATLILTQEKLEEYFTQINMLSTHQPRRLTAYAFFGVNPQISTTEVRSQTRETRKILNFLTASHHLRLSIRGRCLIPCAYS